MLLYLTSNQKSNLIDPAVRNMTLPAKKLVGRFSLKSFVTKDMRNYANAKFFVVDAACIEESGNDFSLALQSFQMMFSARIIVILSGCEDVNGEVQRLLSIGVVNLVTGETMEDALDELTEALSEDGMQRYVVKAPVYEQPVTQREKAPEPDEIIPYRWNARNIRIAVAGSQRRSGVTVTAFIIICDPEAEYFPVVHRLGGQVIKISPTSSQYVNPMDMSLNYSEDDSPLALKSDFILSFCELAAGGRNGLEPVEKTVIDRAVRTVYRPYLADPKPENVPILEDLYDEILRQPEPEAKRIAAALELYVHGSLNVFNHRTNVDINNRLVCFDIKELGKQLKNLGMLVIQDQVWNRVTVNRSEGKST